MRKKLSTIAILIMTSINCQGQFTISDFIISTQGISNEYSKKFLAQKAALADAFNELDIYENIKPVKVKISFEKGVGTILVEIAFVNFQEFANSEEGVHQKEFWSQYGKGITVFLQSKIFYALSSYKRIVARNESSLNEDILKFNSKITIRKDNGDYANFYSIENYLLQDVNPCEFYNVSIIQIAGKVYEVESVNSNRISETNYFFVGKTSGIDGKRTPAYYFLKFFDVFIDQK